MHGQPGPKAGWLTNPVGFPTNDPVSPFTLQLLHIGVFRSVVKQKTIQIIKMWKFIFGIAKCDVWMLPTQNVE